MQVNPSWPEKTPIWIFRICWTGLGNFSVCSSHPKRIRGTRGWTGFSYICSISFISSHPIDRVCWWRDYSDACKHDRDEHHFRQKRSLPSTSSNKAFRQRHLCPRCPHTYHQRDRFFSSLNYATTLAKQFVTNYYLFTNPLDRSVKNWKNGDRNKPLVRTMNNKNGELEWP